MSRYKVTKEYVHAFIAVLIAVLVTGVNVALSMEGVEQV